MRMKTMQIKRSYLLYFLFLGVVCISSFYVFNYTTRIRNPISFYESKGTIASIGISSKGDFFAIGNLDGSLSYFKRGNPISKWIYYGPSEITSIILSVKGNYIVTMDINRTISLFYDVPYLINDELQPRWTYNLPNGTIHDIYSLGGTPPLIYILAASGGKIMLLSNLYDLLWEYNTGTSNVSSIISTTGRFIVATDTKGNLYQFKFNNGKLLWNVSTNVQKPILSLSANEQQIAIGGTNNLKTGIVGTFYRKNGQQIWEHETSRPINFISISSDGSSTVIREENGIASILQNNGNKIIEKRIRIDGEVESIWTTPRGLYIVALNTRENIYFFYLPRSIPLWEYSVGSILPKVVLTTIGEYVFVALDSKVTIISNTYQTGFIPGSRSLWGVVFSFTVLGIITIINSTRDKPIWLVVEKSAYPSILIGFLIGAIIAFFYFREPSLLFSGGVGCSIGSFFSWKREGYFKLFMGWYAGVFGSFFTGYLVGFFVWVGNYEGNIIATTLSNAMNGGLYGIFFGFIGIIGGLFGSEAFSRLSISFSKK